MTGLPTESNPLSVTCLVNSEDEDDSDDVAPADASCRVGNEDDEPAADISCSAGSKVVLSE